MDILQIKNSIMNSVTYVLYSENVDYCILIDCGEWDTLKPVLKELRKRVKAVFLTHGHSDHIYGLTGLLEDDPDIYIYASEYCFDELMNSKKNLSFYYGHPFTVDVNHGILLEGGESVEFEGIGDISVLYTPGHSPSCLSYRISDALFTGDAYIPSVKVYTKFPKADPESAASSSEMLMDMERQGCHVYCGHHSV